MRFMILLRANGMTVPARPRGTEILHDLERYNHNLAKAGVLLATDGLHPLCEGARISFSTDSRQVEAVDPGECHREMLTSYWLLQVRSREEANEWVNRLPTPYGCEGMIELRRAIDPAEIATYRG